MTWAAKAARLAPGAGRAEALSPSTISPVPGHKPRREVEIPGIPSAYAPGKAAPGVARLVLGRVPSDNFAEEAPRVNAVGRPRARED